ncbi:protein PAXX [Engraulis encrasicolus]|uniref:protein PAXX n=1 Tax=Engraulis encrasicolus TaxID=184585 RepID=UPI002FD2D794
MDQSGSFTKQFYFTVSDKTDGSKYLCYTHDCAGVLTIGVTDAEDVWRTKMTDEIKTQLLKHYSLTSVEDCIVKLRSSCGTGNASVSVEVDQVILRLGPSQKDMSLTLSKLPEDDGKGELKHLLFRMADSLSHCQTTEGAKSLYSPGKSSHEFAPRKHPLRRNGAPTGAPKRFAGDSLINPGTRSKKPATGVAFDDADDM